MCGVDVVDQMTRKYTTKAPSRRWPMHIFYNILDIAGINSRVLYEKASNKRINRHSFLEKIVFEILDILSNEEALQHSSFDTEMPRITGQCKKNNCVNKARSHCIGCTKSICGKHSREKTVLCDSCIFF